MLKAHPLADLLPVLGDEALRELADDIREHGLRDPIMTLDGLVLDGRNRLRACELAGVQPRFVAFTGSDPLAYVASMNLHRRHLNESQRALVAARVIEIYERAPIGAPAEEQAAIGASVGLPIGSQAGLPIGSHQAATVRQLAALTNVGERSVARAKNVVRNAVPEVVAAVASGMLAISAAERLSALPPDKQRAELANPPARRRPTPPPTSPHDRDLRLAADLEERAQAFLGALDATPESAQRFARAVLDDVARALSRALRSLDAA